MTVLRAGLAKVDLSTDLLEVEMVGYANRGGGAVGVHDPLYARALVLEHGPDRIALCSVDVCYIGQDVVAAARDRIAARGRIPADAVFISATHTHSGPFDLAPGRWPEGLHGIIDTAVANACDQLQPAVIGAGWGMLHGHSMNRRRFEDPVDPAVLALRVDRPDGTPLGVYYGFACHPVVLGPDNWLISADWPGTCSHLIEYALGPDTIALFGQGATADVNPLTTEVLARLDQGRTVNGGSDYPYYGPPVRHPGLEHDIGDRRGGTFAEMQQLAGAVADEVLRVRRGATPAPTDALWTLPITIRPAAGGGPTGPIPDDHPAFGSRHPERAKPTDPLEVMLVGVDGPGVVLVGQPGEVFAETGVNLRRELRASGVAHPFVVGYANGFRSYLPPRRAFADGGYEVEWAWAMGLPDTIQDEIRDRVLYAVDVHRASSRRTGALTR